MNFFKNHASHLRDRLFRNPAFRATALFHLKTYYYPELQFTQELGWGYRCPFFHPEAQCSFSEIFFEGEYEPVFAEIGLPDRWLDLGCHYGYFTLYTAWLRAKRGRQIPFFALLVDADRRVKPGVEALLDVNQIGSQAAFVHGAIAEGTGSISFHENAFMSSALDGLGLENSDSLPTIVPIIDSTTIKATLPPPYDLIKLDVEGGEFEFLVHYKDVLREAKHVVIEWHSWHRGGGSAAQIQQLAEEQGFQLLRVIQPPKPCQGTLAGHQVGVFLFGRAENH